MMVDLGGAWTVKFGRGAVPDGGMVGAVIRCTVGSVTTKLLWVI